MRPCVLGHPHLLALRAPREVTNSLGQNLGDSHEADVSMCGWKVSSGTFPPGPRRRVTGIRLGGVRQGP